MPRNPCSDHPPIPSPWPGYTMFSLLDASSVDEHDREPLMRAMNGIIAVNWNAREPHWTANSSPFDSRYGLLTIYEETELVAFSVYRMLRIAGRPAIYRSGTEVLPAHQGRGLYGYITAQVLRRDKAGGQRDTDILYGWRTRNPIVWATNAKACRKVTPSLFGNKQDIALQEAGVEMCAALYPGKPLERPSMIMRGAYDHLEHRRQSYRGAALLVDAAMSRVIPKSSDALFSVGYVRTG